MSHGQQITILSYPGNYRVQKSQVAAEYNGVKLNVPAFEFGKDNQTAEFKAKFPMGKVPVMDTPNGPIFESNAMARYVAGVRADTHLLGSTLYEQSIVAQWIDFCTNDIEPCRSVWIYPVLGYLAYNEKNHTEAKKDMTRALTALDTHLLHHTYLAANHVTLADIVVAVTLHDCFARFFDPAFIKAVPNVVRWFTTVANQPEFIKVLGKPTFAKEELKHGAPAKAAAAPAEKKKEEPKKKEEKPKKEEDLGDDEDAPAPKKKNPLDDLPPSPMILDAMKKLAFSERPIKSDFFELLWPQFDANGYSWWTCEYKFNEENKVYWMTENAVGGFIQRCDACRKWALGVMNIQGADEENGPYVLTGAWMWRGTDYLSDMKEENPDSEYYTWTKIDVSTAEGKAKVKEQFMAPTLKQKVLDRRFFK